MLTVWKGLLSRPTMDIDLLGRIDNSIETIVKVTKELCQQEVEPDGIALDAAGIEAERIAEDTEKAAQWRGFIRKNRLTEVPQNFSEVITAIVAFLGPITKNLADGDVFKPTWKAPGPWHK